VVCLFHSRKEGSAKGRGKAHRCGKGGAAGGLQRLWELTLDSGGGVLGKDGGGMVTDWYNNQKLEDCGTEGYEELGLQY